MLPKSHPQSGFSVRKSANQTQADFVNALLAVVAAAQPTEQEKNDNDDHKKAQYAPETTTSIIPPALTVIATSAKEQNEHDYDQDQRHQIDTFQTRPQCGTTRI